MITQRDKDELREFLPIAVTVTVVTVGVILLAHFAGELRAVQGMAFGSFCGFILLARQVAGLRREVRKLRKSDDRDSSKSAV
jgi:hypothetical protein